MLVSVRAFGIDSSNSLPDHAMFGRLEDGSWVIMWKMHEFTLAKHTLATRSLQNPTHIPRWKCYTPCYELKDGTRHWLLD